MRHARVFFFTLFLVHALLLLLLPSQIPAAIEWSTAKQFGIDKEPLDVATSEDGQYVFILVSGEVLVYSVPNNKVTDRIPVEASFDHLTHSGKTNTLILTSRTKKELRIVQLTVRHSFDLAGLAVKGPQDAPVTIAVFSDYQ